MIIKLTEDVVTSKILHDVSKSINASYGNNISAEINSKNDSLIFGDITNNSVNILRVFTKQVPVYYYETDLGDAVGPFKSASDLKSAIIDYVKDLVSIE